MGKRQLQAEMWNINVLGFGVSYIRKLIVWAEHPKVQIDSQHASNQFRIKMSGVWQGQIYCRAAPIYLHLEQTEFQLFTAHVNEQKSVITMIEEFALQLHVILF